MTATNDKSGAVDQDQDRVPELDDDIDPSAEAPSVDEPRDEAPAVDHTKDKNGNTLSPTQQAREAAVRRYRELRDSKKTDEDSDVDAGDDEPARDEVRADPAATPPARRDPTPAAKSPPADPVPAPPDPTVEATRAMLEHAKTLLEEIKSQRAPPAAPAAEADNDEDDPPPPNKTAALDAAKLEDIVERIQIGDKSEGRAALTELIEIMGAGRKSEPAEDIGRVIQSHMAQDRINGEIQAATATFREKYKAIVEDTDLLDTSLRRLNSEMRNDLIQAGLKAEDVNRASPDDLMRMHQSARLQGHRVRAYGEIFEKVGADVTTKFRPMIKQDPPTDTPDPAQAAAAAAERASAERMDRKRQSSAQPRAAGARAQTPQVQPKSRADVVAEMRRQRGFRG